MRASARRRAGLAAWVLTLVATIVAIGAAGHGALSAPPVTDAEAARAWLDARQPAEVVFALVRLLVLTLAWYLLATTLAGVGLRLVGAARLLSVADALSVPTVRRLVEGAVGMSLAAVAIGVAGGFPGPASGTRPAAADAPAAPELVRLAGDAGEEPAEPVMQRLPDDAGNEAPVMAEVVPGDWTIEAGQHLWFVARTVLERAWERPAADSEVTPYWAVLVEANRDRLADPDNADLVFRGQVVTVPPPPPAPPPAQPPPPAPAR